MPTKRLPREVDMTDFPVYRERCATEGCDHPQEQHINVVVHDGKRSLGGKMIACRTEDCECPGWEPTWEAK